MVFPISKIAIQGMAMMEERHSPSVVRCEMAGKDMHGSAHCLVIMHMYRLPKEVHNDRTVHKGLQIDHVS